MKKQQLSALVILSQTATELETKFLNDLKLRRFFFGTMSVYFKELLRLGSSFRPNRLSSREGSPPPPSSDEKRRSVGFSIDIFARKTF